jgi:hypothetical protein
MRSLLAFPVFSVLVVCSACRSNLPVEIPGLLSAKLSDEAQIELVLDDVHQGMETRRIYKVLAHVSRNYRDLGGRDYEGIQEYLKEVFASYREIRITRVRPRIIVDGHRARAIETFGTTAKPKDLPDRPFINLQGQVTVYLEKTNEAWQIVEWGALH